MLRYMLSRLAGAVPTLFAVVLLAFLLVHAAPGGPFDAERALPPEVEANIRSAYDLDLPLHEQFFRYLAGVATGDFGPSFRYRDYRVGELIAEKFPRSLGLGLIALGIALALGMAAGIAAALRRNSLVDRGVMLFAMTGISVPVFVVAPVLVLVFAIKLGWLPAGWSGEPGIRRLVLPAIALALPQVAYIARLMRASLIEVLDSDFVRTARAQGLGHARVLRQHAMKPALLPLVSYLGPAIAAILTGSVVVEEVFGIPGLGEAFVRGSLNRDYTVVLGIVVVYASLVVGLNLVVDLLYGVIDPRIRYR